MASPSVPAPPERARLAASRTVATTASGGGGEPEDNGKSKKQQDALSAYCINLNQKARNGQIDPLIGRE